MKNLNKHISNINIGNTDTSSFVLNLDKQRYDSANLPMNVGISYTPSGKNIEMDFSWYLGLPAMTRDVLVAGVYKPNLNNPRLFQNGDVYRIWRNNGNVEFYVNGLLDGTFPDKYPDRPMYLEAVFYDVNKKVENLYIYKEVLKTHDTIQTTEMVAKKDSYKYSFQNQLRDDEIIKGQVNFQYRGYDPRTGRLNWATDPLKAKYPYYSPYAFSGNRVLDAIELEGAEPLFIDNKLNDAYFEIAGHIDIKYNQKVTVYQRIGLPVYAIAFGDQRKLKGAGYGVKDGGKSVNTQFNPSKTNGTFATVYVGGATATSGNLAEYGVFNSATISGSSQLVKELENSNDLFIPADKLRDAKRAIPDDVAIDMTISRDKYPTNASGLVSENFEAPSSLGEVAATVRVEYALHQSSDTRRAASHAGMEVTIKNSKGVVVASGHGGEDLNFTLDSKEKFSVDVQYSGKANKVIESDIIVNMLYSKPK